jgi:hypothetical protein
MQTETTATEDTNKQQQHREWNGSIDDSQFHLQDNDASNIQQQQQSQQPQLMDTSQMPSMNYDDVDDISRQVQNAIDSILNLQSSDPLHYQLDSSFLELNSITSSGSPNSPLNHLHHNHHLQSSTTTTGSGAGISHGLTPNNQQHNQFQMHHNLHQHQLHQQSDHLHHHHQMMSSSFANQKLNSASSSSSSITSNSLTITKRKYSRIEDIGDCLIGGGTNLDDSINSPSQLSLTLTDSHGDASSASVGEFVNNLLNCDEKSITTS